MKAGYALFISLFLLVLLATFLYLKKAEKASPQPGIGKIILSEHSPQMVKRDYNSCKITYINRHGNEILSDMTMEIRVRGNSSTLFPKKSFAIKLPRKVMMEGMPESTNWILVPNYLDMTFLRNKLSYDLFSAFDSDNKAALTQFVEIYFEDQYHGLYVLTQRVDAEMLNLSDSGLLFKDPPLNFPPAEHPKNFQTFQDYYRNTAQYQTFSPDSRAKMIRRAYYNQRFPKFEEEDHRKVIYELTELLFNTTDSLFCSAEYGIDTYFDLENIIDWHLLLLFTNNYDGIKKNYYLYRESQNALFKVSPWDYDHGYGRDADGEPHPDLLIEFDRLKIFERLVNLNARNYNDRLTSRYASLQEKGIFSKKAVLKLLDSYRQQIKSYAKKNHRKWPLIEHKYLSEATFESEIRLMEKWIEERFTVIENYLETLP